MAAIKTDSLIPNPNNPRVIKDEKFRKLCNSIRELPKMMELRPIVIDENNIVQGGNMRLKALLELGYKEIPSNWVKKAKDFTPEQLKEFIIKDNVGFGEWDWDELANNWDIQQLSDWGIDLPIFENPEPKESTTQQNEFKFYLIKCPVERVDDLNTKLTGIEYCTITESNG